MIKPYLSSLLTGSICEVDESFFPAMDLFCSLLQKTGCKCIITSSFRLDSNYLQGAIVTPATKSNHFVGCAFDCNIIDSNGVKWNSETLKSPSGSVLDLIQLWESEEYRWGGDFHGSPDDVHFDNNLNNANPELWQELYNQIHAPA